MAKGDIPNTNNQAPMSSSGSNQTMSSSGNAAPMWQTLANSGVSYPTSIIPQPMMSQLPAQSPLGPYGNSGINPVNNPVTPQGGSGQAAGLTPSQNLLNQYYGGMLNKQVN